MTEYEKGPYLLLPCPFCGGTPEVIEVGNNHTKRRSVTIRCHACRAERTDAGIRSSLAVITGYAVKAWNTRHTPC